MKLTVVRTFATVTNVVSTREVKRVKVELTYENEIKLEIVEDDESVNTVFVDKYTNIILE